MSVRQDLSANQPADVAFKPEANRLGAPLRLKLSGELNVAGAGLSYALDDKTRPVPGHRLWLPWATAPDEKAPAGSKLTRTDVKGSWLRGKRLFFGQAACATCHMVRAEGIPFGPDLSNLVHRDRESVTHDILQPSAAINPDQVGSVVRFKDGTEISGIVATLNDEKIVVRLPGNVSSERARGDVAAIKPMKVSLMPDGLGAQLSKDQLEDLLTFLLTNPLEPAPITRLDPPPPPPRSLGEITPLLPPASSVPAKNAPLRVLLSAGEKDHGVDEHDYPLWLERWPRLLAMADNVTVTTCMNFPTREQLAAADVTVFYSRNADWDKSKGALLDEYQARGGGLVYLHWAVNGVNEPDALAERIGLASLTKYRHGEMELVFTDPEHPITKGLTRLRLIDETYWAMRGDPARLAILATAVEDGAPQPQLWTMQHQKGRVFGCIPGHYTWTMDDPLYRLLVLRGICWAAKDSDVDRLAELATVGARVAP